MSDLQITAVIHKENGRVGREVKDKAAKSYWITDVVGEKWRVVSEEGQAYWYDPKSKWATLIKVKKERRAE